MSGTGATRRCDVCAREVLDLSAMAAVPAIEALIAREGKACIRYRTDAAGEIQFAAVPPRGPGVIVAAALALSACAGWAEEPESVVPGESDLCISEVEDADACEPVDIPGPAQAPRRQPPPAPQPPGTDRDFTAVVDVAPTSMGDSAGVSLPELERMKAEATKFVAEPAAPIEANIIQGLLVIVETTDRTRSLFSRESTAEPGPDLWALGELLRMKRQLRREERLRRRAGRRG